MFLKEVKWILLIRNQGATPGTYGGVWLRIRRPGGDACKIHPVLFVGSGTIIVLMNYESLLKSMSNNLGTFHRYINKRISHRPDIGALTDDTGNIVTGDLERAELFNCHFASVGVVDNGFLPNSMYRHCGSY